MWVRGMIVICTVSEENVPVENASSEWNNNALLQLQSGLVVIESKDLALRNLQREALGAWFYIIILWIGAVVPKFLRYSISKFQLNLDTSYEETFCRPGQHNWDYFRTVLMNTKHKYFGQNPLTVWKYPENNLTPNIILRTILKILVVAKVPILIWNCYKVIDFA